MADEDLKTLALGAAQDFYELLGVDQSASESEIRRGYRKTALKHHPDKVGVSDQAALDRFHKLHIAYEVLSDPGIRELYDNARRAREEKKTREAAYEGRRKWMKEDLERRESGAFKRKRDDVDEEAAFERELRRLAEDGKRRRKEMEEQLRKEALEIEGEEEERRRRGDVFVDGTAMQEPGVGQVADIDRSLTLRFPKNEHTETLDKDYLTTLFSRFGPIDDAILRDKKLKVEGEKHRQMYTVAVLVFQSIVGAHAAVSDFPKSRDKDQETFGLFEQVGWAGGKEPDCIPKVPTTSAIHSSPMPPRYASSQAVDGATPATPKRSGDTDEEKLRKVPSFASFKAGNTPRGPGTPSSDDITMIRLKNAERRRLEEKIRKEEAEAEAAAAAAIPFVDG